MKSKLLVLALSMFAMSFVAANDTVDAKLKATGAAVEVNADEEEVVVSDTAKKEIAEAAKAKKIEETKAAPQDQNACKSCK